MDGEWSRLRLGVRSPVAHETADPGYGANSNWASSKSGGEVAEHSPNWLTVYAEFAKQVTLNETVAERANDGIRTHDLLITNQLHYHCATLASLEPDYPFKKALANT